jgi:hypothetical protein
MHAPEITSFNDLDCPVTVEPIIGGGFYLDNKIIVVPMMVCVIVSRSHIKDVSLLSTRILTVALGGIFMGDIVCLSKAQRFQVPS